MVIRELGLIDFRNYRELFVGFDAHINVFIGRNGQGKTNLLEAIHLLTHLESFRTRRLAPMIRNGGPLAQLQAVVETADSVHRARIELTPRGKRVWLDDGPVPKVSAYISTFFSLLFNADRLYEYRQFPGQRRTFFDRYLSFLDAAHLEDLKAMREVLQQKNRLLKSPQPRGLAEWDELFLAKSYAIVKRRQDMAQQVGDRLASLFAALTGRGETLGLRYRPSLKGDPGEWPERLRQVAARERDLGHAVVGPQRDDYRLTLDGEREDEAFSQGEYRVGMLALILAMNGVLEERLHFAPALLADDLFSELDPHIQRQVMGHLERLPNQVFITTTHSIEQLFPASARVREIRAGRVDQARGPSHERASHRRGV